MQYYFRFKQTSETVRAKRLIMQIISQRVPGSWVGNSKCPTPIWAQTMSRHNEVITPGRCHQLATSEIGKH